MPTPKRDPIAALARLFLPPIGALTLALTLMLNITAGPPKFIDVLAIGWLFGQVTKATQKKIRTSTFLVYTAASVPLMTLPIDPVPAGFVGLAVILALHLLIQLVPESSLMNTIIGVAGALAIVIACAVTLGAVLVVAPDVPGWVYAVAQAVIAGVPIP